MQVHVATEPSQMFAFCLMDRIDCSSVFLVILYCICIKPHSGCHVIISCPVWKEVTLVDCNCSLSLFTSDPCPGRTYPPGLSKYTSGETLSDLESHSNQTISDLMLTRLNNSQVCIASLLVLSCFASRVSSPKSATKAHLHKYINT